MVSDPSPCTVALVGIGRIGVMHAAILRKHPLVRRLVLASSDDARSARAAKDLDCDSAPVDQVFDPANPLGLDAIVIATATDTHCRLLIRAAATGLPTYCEKPLATNLADARAAQRAIQEAGLPHQIGFQRRLDDGYARAKELLDSGQLGELRRVHAITADQYPPEDRFIPGSGGIFLDANSHDFDILRWVTGREIVEVFAIGSARGSDAFAAAGDVSEAATLVMFDDGTVGTVQASRYNGQGHEVRLDLMGTAGTANVGLDNRVPFHSTETGVDFPPEAPWDDFIERFQPCYERELDHFLRNPVRGLPSICTVDDAVEALRIALAAKQSQQEHRPVRLSELP